MLDGTEDGAAVVDEGVVNRALGADECGRAGGGVAHDGRVLGVQIERGLLAQELHVGLVEGGDGADVAPIGLELVGVEALVVRKQLGDDVATEVMRGVGILSVLLQGLDEEVGGEDVDAHGSEVALGLLRLLHELEDAALVVAVHDAEAGSVLPRHRHDGDGEVGVVGLVGGEHVLVVHTIELVAREDEDVLRILALEEADVLSDGVSGARIPGAAGLGGVRRKNGDAAVALVEVPSLARAEIGVEEVGTILREDADGADAGVRAVGEHEVDDPVLTAERHCRLRDLTRQNAEP